jgi:phage terminase large subunit-like protein
MTFDDTPFVARGHQYCIEVSEGQRIACKWVKKACERHLRDLEKAQTDFFPYQFDPIKGERICKFAQLLPHVKGRWARPDPKTRKIQRLVLEDWQIFVLMCLFGWVRKSSGFRRFQRASLYLPRKNGKSFFACVIGWFMFTKDDEPGAEIYCGATTEAQAWEVFRPSKQMAIVEPKLQTALGVTVYGKAMKAADGSRFEPIIGKPGDGASPHCAIVDEYHEHPDSTLYDTMKTGMGARDQPILLVISTAGSDLSGPCREDWRDCEKLLEGAFEDEQHFAVIWTIDEGDTWHTEDALIKANPNWGVSINPDMILPDMQNAMRDPAKQSIFKTKHLNLWVAAKNGWINMEKWNSCCDLTLKMEDFVGRECWIGVDAASKIDVFSVVALFEHNGGVAVFARHFMPEETIDLPQNEHMRKWVAQGHLTSTPGARTDQSIVEDVLREWADKYYIQEVAYDPKEITYLMQNQVALWAGFPLIEINQGPTLISEPMKEMEAKIETGKLTHSGDPVLTWMASNVVKKTARGGGPVKYQYPAKERPDQKIDGILALIMALSRQMAHEAGFGGVSTF